MSITDFDNLPGTPLWCVSGERTKCHILLLYRMSNAIPAAANDAQARKTERDAKRGGRR